MKLPKPRTTRQLAVALGYDNDRDQVPHVVAKGQGNVASRILELAREKNIPIRHDSDLVQALSKLDLGQSIPEDLYEAVAKVLAWVYRMNGKKGL